MEKIEFIGKLIYHQNTLWLLNPYNKKSWDFVSKAVRHNHISLSKVFGHFKDEDILKITIKKVKRNEILPKH